MDSIDSDGLFWAPGTPECKVAGRLRFLPNEGVSELSLLGALRDESSFLSDRSPYPRILGLAGKKLVTLDDSFQTSIDSHSTGVRQERIHVGRILTGAHFDEGEPLEFEAVTVATDHLAEWVGRSGISTDYERDQASGLLTRVSIHYERPEPESVPVTDGTLTLGFTYQVGSHEFAEVKIAQGCYFRLARDGLTDLDDLLFYCEAIQHLLTIASGSSVLADVVNLWHPEVFRELSSGKRIPEPIGFLAQPVDNVPYKRRRTRQDPLLTFEQIGGLDGVAAWLVVAKRYWRVIGSLLSSRYMAKMYTQNRFFNAAFAAESFHRLRFPNYVRPPEEYEVIKTGLVRAVPIEWQKWLDQQLCYSNEPRLLKRFQDMADYAGEAFAGLVGDVPKWCRLAKNLRNSLAHDDKRSVGPDSETLYYMSESIFYLVVLCLLRECGLADDVLHGITQNSHFLWVRDRVHSH